MQKSAKNQGRNFNNTGSFTPFPLLIPLLGRIKIVYCLKTRLSVLGPFSFQSAIAKTDFCKTTALPLTQAFNYPPWMGGENKVIITLHTTYLPPHTPSQLPLHYSHHVTKSQSK